MPETTSTSITERPQTFAASFGYLMTAGALLAILFCAWFAFLPEAADWSNRLLRILPRISLFCLSLFAMALVRRTRFSDGGLFFCGVLLLCGTLLFQGWAGNFEFVKTTPPEMTAPPASTWLFLGRFWIHGPANARIAGLVTLLTRFEMAIFAAVFLGIWLGRGLRHGWHFFALVIIAGLGDAWLTWNHIPERSENSGFLNALRLPFVPAVGSLTVAPAWTDVLLCVALLEGAIRLRLHLFSVVLAVLAAYISAACLGLEPQPGFVFLSLPLVACGTLAASWPELKLDSVALGKAFLTISLFFLVLCALWLLHFKLNFTPRHVDPPSQLPNMA